MSLLKQVTAAIATQVESQRQVMRSRAATGDAAEHVLGTWDDIRSRSIARRGTRVRTP
jgi:hypothetical protein